MTNTPSASRDYDDYNIDDSTPSPNYNPGTPGAAYAQVDNCFQSLTFHHCKHRCKQEFYGASFGLPTIKAWVLKNSAGIAIKSIHASDSRICLQPARGLFPIPAFPLAHSRRELGCGWRGRLFSWWLPINAQPQFVHSYT